MTVEHVELLVEERSTAEAFRFLLPRLLGTLSFEVHAHQGKQDLLSRLPGKLRGYASWLPETWRIVVVVDRDDNDCKQLKARLEKVTAAAGLATRSTAQKKPHAVVNRLAIEELEAWYFGDWGAVRAAYPRVPSTIASKASYRDPDAIKGGTWEAFEREMKRAGYFKTGLRKIEAARSVAAHMDPDRNTSSSFRALRQALLKMTRA